MSITPQHQIVKIESVKVWVTRLPFLSHLPLSMWRHRVTCLPPKNASAPWGGPGSQWLIITIWQVSYIQYLLACQKSLRSTPYTIVKSGLPWKRVFRGRHLGRRVTAVTCLRWPTVVPCIVRSGARRGHEDQCTRDAECNDVSIRVADLSLLLSLRPSVHPSVCLPVFVTPFSSSSYRSIIKFSVITINKSDVHAKDQGQRSKLTGVKKNSQTWAFPDCSSSPVWIHRWPYNDAQSLQWLWRGVL